MSIWCWNITVGITRSIKCFAWRWSILCFTIYPLFSALHYFQFSWSSSVSCVFCLAIFKFAVMYIVSRWGLARLWNRYKSVSNWLFRWSLNILCSYGSSLWGSSWHTISIWFLVIELCFKKIDKEALLTLLEVWVSVFFLFLIKHIRLLKH